MFELLIGIIFSRRSYDFRLEPCQPDRFNSLEFSVLDDGGDTIVRWKVHPWTVFAKGNDIIYLAMYSYMATGCEVCAYDLKAKRELWRTRVKGLGPIGHSKYENRVNISVDANKVIVKGIEDAGQYIEHLNIDTGETISTEVFAPVQ